jgi:hypothetical protein
MLGSRVTQPSAGPDSINLYALNSLVLAKFQKETYNMRSNKTQNVCSKGSASNVGGSGSKEGEKLSLGLENTPAPQMTSKKKKNHRPKMCTQKSYLTLQISEPRRTTQPGRWEVMT